MVYYFLEGGAFMWPILMTLIFGLAFVIERAYSLMMSGVDSQVFFEEITSSVKEKGVIVTDIIIFSSNKKVTSAYYLQGHFDANKIKSLANEDSVDSFTNDLFKSYEGKANTQ